MNKNNIFEEKRKIKEIFDSLNKENVTKKEIDKNLTILDSFESKNLKEELTKRVIYGDEKEFNTSLNIILNLGDDSYEEMALSIIFNNDLIDERKAFLIPCFEEIGCDFEEVNFNTAFKDLDSMKQRSLDLFIQEASKSPKNLEQALLLLYEIPEEDRVPFIKAILEKTDETTISIIEKLLMMEDKNIAELVFNKISKSNDKNIYALLKKVLQYISEPEIIDSIERTIRKMSLKGISIDEKDIKVEFGEIYKVFASSIDGVGSRSIIIARKFKRRLKCFFVLINEKIGIKDAFYEEITIKELEKMVLVKAEENDGVIFTQIIEEKAVKLVKDALYINKQTNAPVLPSFNIYRTEVFKEKKLVPEEYVPQLGKNDINKISQDLELLKESDKIFDFDICDSWFLDSEEIETFIEKKNKGKDKFINQKIKKEFINTFIVPIIPYLKRRLLHSADFYIEANSSSTKIKKIIKVMICTAMNIEKDHNIQFISEMAEISLQYYFQGKFHNMMMSLLNGGEDESDFFPE